MRRCTSPLAATSDRCRRPSACASRSSRRSRRRTSGGRVVAHRRRSRSRVSSRARERCGANTCGCRMRTCSRCSVLATSRAVPPSRGGRTPGMSRRCPTAHSPASCSTTSSRPQASRQIRPARWSACNAADTASRSIMARRPCRSRCADEDGNVGCLEAGTGGSGGRRCSPRPSSPALRLWARCPISTAMTSANPRQWISSSPSCEAPSVRSIRPTTTATGPASVESERRSRWPGEFLMTSRSSRRSTLPGETSPVPACASRSEKVWNG